MKAMNHGEYPEQLKTKSDAALAFIKRDAREALDAMPGGPNAGYYADEISYVGMEQVRREKANDE